MAVAYAASVAALLTIDEALAHVLSRVRPLPAEPVALADAAGRYLAEDARSAVDLPPFPSSAMDGYAVRAQDLPATLPVVARVAAGRPAGRPLAAGEAMGIATGGVVPDGADAVVPVEYVVDHDNASVQIESDVTAGANVRPRGGDVAAGAVLVERGTRLSPARLGALAAGGVSRVLCAARPRAAVLATGTELRSPGEPLEPGQVYESNGLTLSAQLATAGAEVERLAPVVDDEEAHRVAIEHGLDADLLVTSGGVSVGPHDLVRRIEAALGVEEVFWRVAMKPGKPVAFGVRGSTLVFGLPGNPVSSLVAFELFVRPALEALQGAADPGPHWLPGRLARAQERSADRDQLVRARRRGGDEAVELEPLSGQESHMIGRAAGADAIALVPRGEGVLAAGSAVRWLPLS
jgi:molybdopterin molybdotransferase